MFAPLKRMLAPDAGVHAFYTSLVAKSRAPFLYEACGIPDTLDGRYESIILHIHLATQTANATLKQALMECFIEDMDRSLREMGVGDTGVGKRVKKMAAGLFGRLQAYGKVANTASLKDILKRNVYSTCETPPTEEHVAALVEYITHTAIPSN